MCNCMASLNYFSATLGGAEPISGSHTITRVLNPLMFLPFNNIVIIAIYGSS